MTEESRAGRFDYVPFNEPTRRIHEQLKRHYEEVEAGIAMLDSGRAKSLALTKLEESFMWIGKAVKQMQGSGACS